ncbi:MAG: phosphoserine phosphatase SerB [Parvularcula sp.]|jgi:phosphoserine phosphatase|nr:phosphoserine phosphatase SerB [Parvularcula sp.]
MTTHAVVLIGERAPEALEVAVRQLGVRVQPLGERAAEAHFDEAFARRVAAALSKNTGYDVACVALAGREKKLLLADMDATIIGQESLDELADALHVGAQVKVITDKAMRGEIPFEAALRARVKLLEGVRIDDAAAAMRDRLKVNEGAVTLVRTAKALGMRTALVTGGFLMFAGPIGEQVGFDDVYANRLTSRDGYLTGEAAEPILGREAKAERLKLLCAEMGIKPAEVVAVGDGANDLDMIKAAGLGVGYRPKPILAEAADAVLKRSDLTGILSLLGIPEGQWKTR